MLFNARQSKLLPNRSSIVTEVLTTVNGHFVKVEMIPSFLPDLWFILLVVSFEISLWLLNIKKNIKLDQRLYISTTKCKIERSNLIISPLSVYAVFVYCHYM